jgi:ubiquinol-cytochrome c reductase cytochrome c subunit
VTAHARTVRRRRPVSGYLVVLLGLALVGGLYAYLAPSSQAEAPSASNAKQIEYGAQLFRTNCSSCHGLQAQGSNEAPSLIGAGAAAVDFQVSTGRMPLSRPGAQAERGVPKFNRDQVEALASYVGSLAPGPQIPSKSDLNYSDASLAEGGELFRTNCASCHSFAAKGGALSEGKVAPNITPANPREMYEAMLTGPENMPVFGDTQLPPDKKQAIIKFLQTTKAQADPGGTGIGRIGPVPEGLVAFVVGVGVLVLGMLWIGARAGGSHE